MWTSPFQAGLAYKGRSAHAFIALVLAALPGFSSPAVSGSPETKPLNALCVGSSPTFCCPSALSSGCVTRVLEDLLKSLPRSRYKADATLAMIKLLYRRDEEARATKLTRVYLFPEGRQSAESSLVSSISFEAGIALSRTLLDVGKRAAATKIAEALKEAFIVVIDETPPGSMSYHSIMSGLNDLARIRSIPVARQLYAYMPDDIEYIPSRKFIDTAGEILRGRPAIGLATIRRELAAWRKDEKRRLPPTYLMRLTLLAGDTAGGLALADEIEADYLGPDQRFRDEYLKALAISLAMGGQYERAIATANKMPPVKLSWGPSITQQAKAYAVIADFAAGNGQKETAARVWRLLVDRLVETPDETAYGTIMPEAIRLMCDLEEFETAKQAALLFEKALHRAPNKNLVIKRLAESAVMLGKAGAIREGELVLQRSVDLFDQAWKTAAEDPGSRDRYGFEVNLRDIFYAQVSLGRLADAAVTMEKLDSADHVTWQARAQLSAAYAKRGDQDEANKHLAIVLQRYEPSKSEPPMFGIAIEIADALHQLGR